MAIKDEMELYRAYILAKNDPNKTITSLAEDFGITRYALYNIVKRIETGNEYKIKECTRKARLECLWRYKYQPRYIAIPKDQKPETVQALIDLIHDMYDDGFSALLMSRLIDKDRSTIIHHLAKKK